MGVRLPPIVFAVLICISVITSDVKDLFMCLLAVCVSSVERSLPKAFPCYLFRLFAFLLSFRSSLSILDFNPLSDRWLANIFFHSVGCLFTLLIVSSDAQNLNFHEVQFAYFFFCHLCLWCSIQEVIAKSNVVKFLSHVFL